MFNIQIGTTKYDWTQELVQQKLEAIGQLKDKKVSWIRADLSTTQSSRISRWVWTFIAKHFNCIRERLFKVNLEQSKAALQQIGEKLDKADEAFLKIYNKAVEKFNEVAPSHQVALAVCAAKTKSNDQPPAPTDAVDAPPVSGQAESKEVQKQLTETESKETEVESNKIASTSDQVEEPIVENNLLVKGDRFDQLIIRSKCFTGTDHIFGANIHRLHYMTSSEPKVGTLFMYYDDGNVARSDNGQICMIVKTEGGDNKFVRIALEDLSADECNHFVSEIEKILTLTDFYGNDSEKSLLEKVVADLKALPPVEERKVKPLPGEYIAEALKKERDSSYFNQSLDAFDPSDMPEGVPVLLTIDQVTKMKLPMKMRVSKDPVFLKAIGGKNYVTVSDKTPEAWRNAFKNSAFYVQHLDSGNVLLVRYSPNSVVMSVDL